MDTRLCPHCGACIGEDEIICPFCSEELVSFEDGDGDFEREIFQDEAEEKDQCVYCGADDNLSAEKHDTSCPINILSCSQSERKAEKTTNEWEKGWSDGSSARKEKKSGSPSYRLGYRRGYSTFSQSNDI